MEPSSVFGIFAFTTYMIDLATLITKNGEFFCRLLSVHRVIAYWVVLGHTKTSLLQNYYRPHLKIREEGEHEKLFYAETSFKLFQDYPNSD